MTKFIEVFVMNLVTPDAATKHGFFVQLSVMNLLTTKAASEHELLFNDPASKTGFLSIAVRLRSSTKCDQIHRSVCYEFGPT